MTFSVDRISNDVVRPLMAYIRLYKYGTFNLF